MTTQLKRYYKGFSTRSYEDRGGNFATYNQQCVEEDLLNEIFTVRGDRLMMPDYGTRIPIMTFEPNDEESAAIIRSDLNAVFSHDPRVEVLNLDVIPATEKSAFIAIAKLRYVEFNVVKDLYLEVNSQ